jgi:hypothetical protein
VSFLKQKLWRQKIASLNVLEEHHKTEMPPQKPLTAFLAYPSNVSEVVDTMRAVLQKIPFTHPSLTLHGWEANDIAGRCLVDPILDKIETVDFIVADITHLNFNVVYEIGYAIGKRKRTILIRNKTIRGDDKLARDTGIFDTIGYESYLNSEDLLQSLGTVVDTTPLPIKQEIPNKHSPVYLVTPREKAEAEIRLFSRIKKEARLSFRSYDPQEHGRLSVRDAIDNVAASLGVILPLLSSNRTDSEVHNLRCSFVAGLSHALSRETLILQAGDEPVPLDLRDAISSYTTLASIDRYVAQFAPRITERLQEADQQEFAELQTPITKLFLGASAAENEYLDLSKYYIQTDEFQRVLRGEVQVIAGRKGSGKSALFFQVRNKLRNNRQNVVLDLNPEGFQLRKLKKLVLDHLEEGTREHTITAFWEYMLLLEIAQKLLENDRVRHLRDHTLRDLYQALDEVYRSDPFVSHGDFAERLLRLTEGIEERFEEVIHSSPEGEFLSREKVTEFIYKHDLPKLRKSVVEYLERKEDVWVLFDNLDKGWAAHGVDASDLLSVKCLLNAFTKLRHDLKRREIDFFGVVFIRNDVYELLIDSIPDRGKISKALLDWTDPDLLREVLRRRFVMTLKNRELDFDTVWRSVAVTHILNGQDSSTYLLKRCLMRPRALIDLLGHCRGHAINLGHEKILEADFIQGEIAYSTDLVNQISLELQDIFEGCEDILYVFIEATALLDKKQLCERLKLSLIGEDRHNDLIELLLWYGVLGILRQNAEATYIYDVNYEIKKLNALINQRPEAELVYIINPAFWRGLEVTSM